MGHEQALCVRDHPRVCGKNFFWCWFFRNVQGSPPRVREKLCSQQLLRSGVRITPACAGKTYFSANRVIVSRDHPRVCGKNAFVEQRSQVGKGSPPRVREKLEVDMAKGKTYGITPACAGKTTFQSIDIFVLGDHPRVCGKNSWDFPSISYAMGSPPRVREKPLYLSRSLPTSGITPACAGKTSPSA